MEKKWYVNWLVVITAVLFISALGIFILSIQNSLGLKKCAYGDIVFNEGKSCICDSKGKVVCDDEGDTGSPIRSDEFTTQNLSFTSTFQGLITAKNNIVEDITFSDISQVGNILKVTVEKRTMCNSLDDVAPQVGFYRADEDRIIFTIGTNLVDPSFNTPCVSENVFQLMNAPVKFTNDFKIFYQDEYGSLIPSGNCIYEGFVRNEEDVYNSSDGCFLCVCRLGQNICEQEKKCLE